jgi:hypothetical protein
MESHDLRRWFGAYLEVFEACGRGSANGFGRLLDYYDVPFLLSSDDGVLSLTSEAEVRRALQQQIDGMRAAGYHRSEVLESDVEVLNMVSSPPAWPLPRSRRSPSTCYPTASRPSPCAENRRRRAASCWHGCPGRSKAPAATVDALIAASPA